MRTQQWGAQLQAELQAAQQQLLQQQAAAAAAAAEGALALGSEGGALHAALPAGEGSGVGSAALQEEVARLQAALQAARGELEALQVSGRPGCVQGGGGGG